VLSVRFQETEQELTVLKIHAASTENQLISLKEASKDGDTRIREAMEKSTANKLERMQAEEQRGWVMRQNADHHMKLEQAEEMREELNECKKKVVDLKSEIARLHILLVDKDDDIERQQKLGEAAAQQHKEFHGKKDAAVDDLRSQV
jgi:chromosome segregation ATPase